MADRTPMGRGADGGKFAGAVRGGATAFSNRGWTAGGIAPPELPIPPGFLSPEEVAARSQERFDSLNPKPIRVEDFLTDNVDLNDPTLASRPFSSAITKLPTQVGASISAFGNSPAPAFLTDAVNRLNQAQTNAATSASSFRNQLLDAVLGGNFLAAEALRASVVNPGSSVAFGAPVGDPSVGQGFLLQSQAAADESETKNRILNQGSAQIGSLQANLGVVGQKLKTLTPPGAGGLSSAATGQKRATLQLQQRKIQQELERQQNVLAQGGAFAPSSGFVPRLPGF